MLNAEVADVARTVVAYEIIQAVLDVGGKRNTKFTPTILLPFEDIDFRSVIRELKMEGAKNAQTLHWHMFEHPKWVHFGTKKNMFEKT